MYMLEWAQHSTGLPWWATIVGCTLILRAALAPASVYMTRSTARLAVAKPELTAVQDEMKRQLAMCGDDYAKQQKYASEAQTKMWAIYRKNGANPLFSFVPIILQVRSHGHYTHHRAV
jgi:membrane protein insertase Oxa1/YidC/SpoIIIJ